MQKEKKGKVKKKMLRARRRLQKPGEEVQREQVKSGEGANGYG